MITLFETLKQTHDSLRFNEQGHVLIALVKPAKEARKAYKGLQDYKVISSQGPVLILEEKHHNGTR